MIYNITRPYWHMLISYWVNKKKKNGLTIPFIIGAEQFQNTSLKIAPMTVYQLLSEIINSDTDDIITLLYCDTIGDYVLGLNNSYNSMKGLEVKNQHTNKTTLIATLSTIVLGNNINEIIKALTEKYADCLTDKKYSLIKSNWADFDESDIKIINEALSKK